MVKAIDSKSIGVSPHRFESCRLRDFIFRFHLLKAVVVAFFVGIPTASGRNLDSAGVPLRYHMPQ